MSTKTEHPPFPYPFIREVLPDDIIVLSRVKLAGMSERIVYQCPDSCWREHRDAYAELCRKREASGCESATLEPFPFNHTVFNGAHNAWWVPVPKLTIFDLVDSAK